jgi:hypothetical protein
MEGPKTNIPKVEQAASTLHRWELRVVFKTESAGTYCTVFI